MATSVVNALLNAAIVLATISTRCLLRFDKWRMFAFVRKSFVYICVMHSVWHINLSFLMCQDSKGY